MDEWVKLENLNLNTVDVADIEGPDSKGWAPKSSRGIPLVPQQLANFPHGDESLLLHASRLLLQVKEAQDGG